MKNKKMIILITIFILTSLIMSICTIINYKISVNKKKTGQSCIQKVEEDEVLEYEDWYDLYKYADDSRLQEIEKTIKISSYEDENDSCSYLIYPVKIDGKYIRTYSEEEYRKEFLKIFLSKIGCTSDAYITFPENYKVLDVRNTKVKSQYTLNKNNLIVKHQDITHDGGLDIVKIKIDEDNIVELLF